MADQRMQYQQYNDEIKKKKEQIAGMRDHPMALTEQFQIATCH
jgi:hypothetical protein